MKIVSKKEVCLTTDVPVYDLTVPKHHNFVLANGAVVHNSSKRARNSNYQEVLPLKGKIKNPFKQAATDSEELFAILMALGYDPTKENPLENLRVGKLILLTDGDVDGAHIQTLILGAILAYVPEMFEQGRVYACKPYEYMVEHGGEWHFSEDKQELLDKLPASAHGSITHIKGWGERLPLSSYLYTDQGLITLGDIVRNKNFSKFQVDTTTGFTSPLNAMEFGSSQSVKIDTLYGLGLIASDNHPVMVLNKDCHIVWKKASEVEEGDFLALNRGGNFPNYRPRFHFPVYTSYSGDTTVAFPERMTTDLARLLGYWVADGSGPTIHCGVDYDYVLDAQRLFESLFKGCETKISVMHPDNDVTAWSVSVTKGSSAVWAFLSHLGLSGCTAYNKEIPICIRESSKKYMAAFLQGLFEGDGYASDHKIEYYTASPELFKQVVVALNNFGVICKCDMQVSRYNPFSGSVDDIPANRLWIHGGFIERFNQEIGFFSKRKRGLFKKYHYSNVDCIPHLADRIRYYKSKSVGNLKGTRLFEIDGQKVAVELGALTGAKNITYASLDNYPQLENIRIFDEALAKTIEFCKEVQPFWTEVTKVTPCTPDEDFGDLTLPSIDNYRGSSYVANGYVVHNCGSDVLFDMAFNPESRILYQIKPENLKATTKRVRALMESEGGVERKKLLGLIK